MLVLLATLAFAAASQSEVVLDDGQVLRGLVEVEENGSVLLTLGSGTILRFPKDAVREVRALTAQAPTPADARPPAELPLPSSAPGEAQTASGWPRDPNRNRYFYSPSAFSSGRGRGYVSQKEIVLTEVSYGVTDFWDVQAGTSLITLFLEGGQFAVVGTKLAMKVSEHVRLGVGAQALFLPAQSTSLTLAFGTVTVGDEDKHLSVSGGTAIGFFDGSAEVAPGALLTVSGNLRVGPSTALITENWFILGDFTADGVFAVPSLGVRLFGPHFATDLGVLVLASEELFGSVIPLPWVGFTYNFALPNASSL